MAREPARARCARALEICRRLAGAYPGSATELCALCHADTFQLLVATILSAQCTDERVNMVTPGLFARYPGPSELAGADPSELEDLIRPTGFFRTKARHLIEMSVDVAGRFGGELPRDIDDLTSLPGVGRKTANVVRSVGFGLPGLPVDTHVGRLARRLRLASEQDPVKVEASLCRLVPEEEWGALSLRLILHGRLVCLARRPRCSECLLADVCPSAGIGSVAPLPSKRRPGGAVAEASATGRPSTPTVRHKKAELHP
ncbi:MAG: endonuclease III [Acidimicrobiales bacterium]